MLFTRKYDVLSTNLRKKNTHPKTPKIQVFRSPPTTCKKSEIFDDGHKLAVGLRDSMPKSAVFSVRRGRTYELRRVGAPHMRSVPKFFVGVVGSLSDVVSFCQVWFGYVHFAGETARKPFQRTLSK